MLMTFADRADAGQKLGGYLVRQNVRANLVLGLPRGGVVVAAEVASMLQCPLEALVVRKIGHPQHREFAVGALAEDGTVVLDDTVMERTGVESTQMQDIIKEETGRLAKYRAKFRRSNESLIDGKTVVIVDDGIATGATMEVAVRSARNQGAANVIVAAPVASDSAVERLRLIADDVFIVQVDPEFESVGRYYLSFPETTDDEVQYRLGISRTD